MIPTRVIVHGDFGEPVLKCGGVGKVGWVKDTGNALGLHQKSASGYLANLYGGAQSGGNNWAAVYIPVNELSLTELRDAMWSYYLTNAETMGVNMVIWVHDPKDFDKRAEITQLANIATLEKAAGWDAHELDVAVDQFFFYGEGTTGTGLTAGPANLYGLDDFRADALFKDWRVYRVSFEYGWEASGTFEDAWVADIKLNGQMIWLVPRPGEVIGRETKTIYAATPNPSTTKATTITPAATKRVRILNVFVATASNTGANFEVYFHTGANLAVDTTKAIFLAHLDLDGGSPSARMNYGDNGPLGAIGEVVSTRTSVDITTNGHFLIVYREE